MWHVFHGFGYWRRVRGDYDSYAYQGAAGWMVFGGTSVASPIVASVDALGGGRAGSASSPAYGSFSYKNPTLFNDVTRLERHLWQLPLSRRRRLRRPDRERHARGLCVRAGAHSGAPSEHQPADDRGLLHRGIYADREPGELDWIPHADLQLPMAGLRERDLHQHPWGEQLELRGPGKRRRLDHRRGGHRDERLQQRRRPRHRLGDIGTDRDGHERLLGQRGRVQPRDNLTWRQL